MQIRDHLCADAGTFIRCHLNAFEALGGIPKRCLYEYVPQSIFVYGTRRHSLVGP